MNLKSFPVFSPQAGLITDQPSILLPSVATSDVQDMYFQSGEVKRYKKRMPLFSSLPDPIIKQFTFNQASEDKKYFIYFTAKDLVYRDRANDNYVFINPIIDSGSIIEVEEVTGNQTQLKVELGTGISISSIKAGDYIRIGQDGLPTTDDVW